jgi:nicotinamide phosphoribosyltransferase
MHLNPLLRTDSYKISHPRQYPPDMTAMYDYVEARKGGRWDKVLFFGLQKFIRDYLLTPITMVDVCEAAEFYADHFNDASVFDRAAFEHIVHAHGGYFPVEICAVPEGTVLPTGQVLVTVRSTDPKCAHVVSFLETALLRDLWYGSTVATNSWHIKQRLKQALQISADTLEALPFQLHDFGARGVSSGESAMMGGMAHLVNFRGSDTLEAIFAAGKYYGMENRELAGYSVPASEHSTMTAWGDAGFELDAFTHLLEQFGGKGKIFSCVCDSYDLDRALGYWCGPLKVYLLNSGSRLVVRPDSGDPVTSVMKCLESLHAAFGGELNSKAFRVLPDCVRVIQGDGIDEEMVRKILAAVIEHGRPAAKG